MKTQIFSLIFLILVITVLALYEMHLETQSDVRPASSASDTSSSQFNLH